MCLFAHLTTAREQVEQPLCACQSILKWRRKVKVSFIRARGLFPGKGSGDDQ